MKAIEKEKNKEVKMTEETNKLKELIPYVIIIVVVVLIRTFLVTPAIVRGDSMDPTLKNNEVVIVNKIIYTIGNINRFDMVVIKHEGEILIKRVIALPNEKIVYKDNELYIDDILVSTNIKFEETEDFEHFTRDDEYFCLGDNRDISKDSRSFGPFKSSEITGKVSLVIFPFKRMGIKE